VINRFSTNLGLTEQQRQQVVPILKEELKQLEALKKDTSLSGVRKIERVREIGNSIDERLKPLINPEQQQKFEALREDLRKRFVDKVASEAKQKIESGVKAWFTEKSVK
jgi:protein CpxP